MNWVSILIGGLFIICFGVAYWMLEKEQEEE